MERVVHGPALSRGPPPWLALRPVRGSYSNMLCTVASLVIIELAVVFAELRVSDILNAELLPSTLLLEGNVTRRSFKRRSPIAVPEALRRRPGNWTQAFTTMDFHR